MSSKVQQSEGRNRCKFWQVPGAKLPQQTATTSLSASARNPAHKGSQLLCRRTPKITPTTSHNFSVGLGPNRCHEMPQLPCRARGRIVLQSLAISLSEKAQTTATNGNNLSVGLGPIYRQKTTQPLCRAGEWKGSQMAIFRAVFIISANRNKYAPRSRRSHALRARCLKEIAWPPGREPLGPTEAGDRNSARPVCEP